MHTEPLLISSRSDLSLEDVDIFLGSLGCNEPHDPGSAAAQPPPTPPAPDRLDGPRRAVAHAPRRSTIEPGGALFLDNSLGALSALALSLTLAEPDPRSHPDPNPDQARRTARWLPTATQPHRPGRRAPPRLRRGVRAPRPAPRPAPTVLRSATPRRSGRPRRVARRPRRRCRPTARPPTPRRAASTLARSHRGWPACLRPACALPARLAPPAPLHLPLMLWGARARGTPPPPPRRGAV